MKDLPDSQNLRQDGQGQDESRAWAPGGQTDGNQPPSVARMKRVAWLRAAIIRGEYRVAGEALAEKLLPLLMGRKQNSSEFTSD